MKRKSFIEFGLFSLAGTALAGVLNSCRHHLAEKIKFIRSGANASIGHLLREDWPANISVRKIIETDILIIGGGISGLSAAYFLQKNNYTNYILAELDEQPGGNSKSGENEFSKYPYGAHYLPIPNLSNKLLIGFLAEKGLITSFDERGIPIYDEFAVCSEPDERLLINNYWQEGIVPNRQQTKEDETQIRTFFDLVDKLKNEKGEDGKFVFDIPLASASTINEYIALDNVSFEEYLHREGFTSKQLLWYLRYCCRDDYGQSFEKVSAFAGLHYFAARRGRGSNCDDNSILTWPEGNGKLVQLLCDSIKHKIQSAELIRKVELKDEHCEAMMYNWKTENWRKVKAAKVLIATPIHVRRKIFDESFPTNLGLPITESQPWLVASITAKTFTDRNGFPLSWDNVMMEANSLGFVFAQHQALKAVRENYVFTLYKPLDEESAKNMRLKYYDKTDEELQQEIISELSVAFPQIEKEIIEIDCHIHGHGMISPGIGYLKNENKAKLTEAINGKIFFAHTDYSGISIFEEAFWQGHRAAMEVLKHIEHV